MTLFRRRPLGWEASLKTVQHDLAAAREEAAVMAEQLASLRDDAEEARIRSLVSENTADLRESRHAGGHAERLEKGLLRMRARITALEEKEQALLNKPLFDD